MSDQPTRITKVEFEEAHGHPSRSKILPVLVLSLVVVVAANASLNLALPTLVEELGASARQLQWIVDSYAIVFAGLLLPFGALGDRFGRKGALQLGLLIYGLAALLSTQVSTANQLIATRSIMGIGAALIMPATLSILSAVYPPHERSKAIAIWAGFAGAGGAIGIVSGGYLLEHFSWQSVFYLNIPIVALAMIIGALIVPTSRQRVPQPLDPFGALLSMGAVFALLYAIIEAPEVGWLAAETFGVMALAVALLVGFVMWEKSQEHPMLEIDFFSNPRFSSGAVTIFLAFLAMFGVMFLGTQYLQFVRGYSPLLAGVATLPMALTMVVVSPRSATLAEKFGPRRMISSGLFIAAVGLGLFALVTPTSPYLGFAAALVVMAAGMGLAMAPATASIMGSVPLDKAGVGSAVNDTTREIGGALGVAALGSIFNSMYRGSLDDLVGLPDKALEAARGSIGSALFLADEVGGPQGEAIRTTALDGFTHGFSTATLVAAAAMALAGVIVLKVYPPLQAGEILGVESETASVG